MWQRYRQGHPGQSFELLAVAQDAASADVRPWAERQPLDFPVLVDRDLLLAQQYGMRAIPSVIVIDPDGVVRLKVAGGFSINRPEHVAQLEAALDGIRSPVAGGSAPLNEEAARLFREGAALYATGARQEAARRWRQAAALEPDNFIIRKQLWWALHPERFGETLDLEWQRGQLARESAEGVEGANSLGEATGS